MTVRDTSLDAFRENLARGIYQSQKAALAALVETTGPAPRRELAERSGLEISAVCGAVNSLIKTNVLQDPKVVTCQKTGRPVHLVERVPFQVDAFS